MARRCIYCKKGIGYGHAVSHAKNRTKRLFRPNLQKLKVLQNGNQKRVVLCTSCIQRLKKDSRLGTFSYKKFVPKVEEKEVKKVKPAAPKPVEKKEEKEKPAMDISEIVGKKK